MMVGLDNAGALAASGLPNSAHANMSCSTLRWEGCHIALVPIWYQRAFIDGHCNMCPSRMAPWQHQILATHASIKRNHDALNISTIYLTAENLISFNCERSTGNLREVAADSACESTHITSCKQKTAGQLTITTMS